MDNYRNNDLDSKLRVLGLRIELLDPISMSDVALEKLTEELYHVALDAFNKSLPYDAIASRTKDSTYILLLKKDEKILGYAENEKLLLGDVAVNYYSTALFSRTIQGNGLYSSINLLRKSLIDANVVMTRTQNPVVYRAFKKMCEKIGYELYHAGSIDRKAGGIAAKYCPESRGMIVKGVYFGRSLMDDTPAPMGEEISLWKHLDIEKGDAAILVGMQR